jgi:hypothetical protein
MMTSQDRGNRSRKRTSRAPRPVYHLTEADRRRIGDLYNAGMTSHAEIARTLGIDPYHVHKALAWVSLPIGDRRHERVKECKSKVA